MRTHGHKRGNRCWGLLEGGGMGRDSRELGDWEGITLREIPNVGDGGMDVANHYGTFIPM